MASSKNSEPLITSESLGTLVADVLQEEMLDRTENTSQAAVSNAQGDINDFDNLILPNIIAGSTVTTVDDTRMPSDPSLMATATSIAEAYDLFESRFSSVCNNASILTDENNATVPRSSTTIDQLQAQASVTTLDNKQVQPKLRRHIMISYHHKSSSDICNRICTRLRERHYEVWMDSNDLHGPIHQGMAEAVENSYLVLFCMNHEYYESEYCRKEGLYTDKRHIDFIPCIMESSYKPEGWLGILIGDQLYIDFSSPDNFDAAFEELIAEIQVIQNRLQISPVQTITLPQDGNTQRTTVMSTLNTDTSANNQIQSDSLRAVIRDFRESINRSNHAAQPMTEEEFSQFVSYLRQRVFTNISPLPQTENNNVQGILQEILQHSQNQTEYLKRITEILSNLTEPRTIITLSLAFAFVWAINTFLKHK